jgi:hypothetical protein
MANSRDKRAAKETENNADDEEEQGNASAPCHVLITHQTLFAKAQRQEQ